MRSKLSRIIVLNNSQLIFWELILQKNHPKLKNGVVIKEMFWIPFVFLDTF